MRSDKVLQVNAFWDQEASVWVAESDDVPGLVAEATTMDDLVRKLQVLIPELLEANGIDDGDDIPFSLVSQLRAVAHRARA